MRHCARFAALLFAASSASAASAPLFEPAFRADFPDPFIIEHGGEYLAYATNTERGRQNVQMAVSGDLVNWRSLRDPADPKRLHDAMPALPAWVKRGHTWAPEVMKTSAGYVLYFTARHRASGQQCLGTAVAADPRGPFAPVGTGPFVCQHDLGGTIDASPFRDADGRLYLYYKNDGNHPSARRATEIWVRPMTPDGLSFTGPPVSLLTNDKPWEAHVIEAPSIVRNGTGTYTLFFSANDYGWQPQQRLSAYAFGYATCRTPLGPCTDAPDNPLLHSFSGKPGCLSGPGHQNVFEARGRQFIAFHAWTATGGCRPANKGRAMYIAPLGWDGDKPVIGPSLRTPVAVSSR